MIRLLLLVFLLSGCARLPITGADAARLTSVNVARIDPASLFAAAPGGKRVAFSFEGVRVATLPSGEPRTISAEQPQALAWAPDGSKLAVAFARGTESRITVFGDDGALVAETAAAGHVGALFWPASDTILAVAVELEPHSFGSTCRELLLRWQPGGVPERTVLHEVTLRAKTAHKLGAGLIARAINPALSPLGDELVYGRIKDPPAFDAYLKVMVRNLSGGAERELAKAGFNDGAPRFSADGEDLILDDGTGRISRIDAWDGTKKKELPFSGRILAVSPDGSHLLADGRLLGDDREVARFPPGSNGAFLDDGRLLLAASGTLYLLSGFEAAAAGPIMPPEKLERLRTLRTWRASGLISASDYNTAKEKVMK